MSNKEKIDQLRERINTKRNQVSELTKDLNESIIKDLDEIKVLEKEWLKVVNWIEKQIYDWALYEWSYYEVVCPYCSFDLNSTDINISWNDNEIIICDKCNKNFVIWEWDFL